MDDRLPHITPEVRKRPLYVWRRIATWSQRARSAGLRRLSASAVLALALLTAALMFPSQLRFVAQSLPVIALWTQPEAQQRLQLGDVPYDMLRTADTLLPRDAVILLITSGQDVRHREYITFHRALYYLTPRPVWWLSPAPPDGTWEARWWRPAPLTRQSVRAFAAEKGARYALTLGVTPALAIDTPVARIGDSALVRLDDRAPVLDATPRLSYAGRFWPLQLAAALAIVAAIGYAALQMIGITGFRTGRIETAALAWPLGAGLTSIGMLWLNAAGFGLGEQVVALTGLALVGMLVGRWALRRRPTTNDQRPTTDYRPTTNDQRPTTMKRAIRPSSLILHPSPFILRAALLLFLVLQVTFVAALAMGRPLVGWDAWSSWVMKARTIWIEGAITPAVYADPSRASTLPYYPLSIPLLDAWVFHWLGAPDDRLVGATAVLFHLALAGVCYAALRRRGASDTYALAATTALVSMPYMTLLSGFVFVDVPLAVFVVIAAVYLLDWLDGGDLGGLIVAALAAGLLGWVKREGLPLLAVLCLVALVVARGSRRAWLATGALGLAGMLLAAPWWMFIARYGSINTDFLPLSQATLAANIGRVPTIVRMALAELLSPQWSLIWSLAALLGLLRRFVPTRGARLWHSHALLPLVAAIYLGVMCAGYVFSGFAPYEAHIRSSLWRLVAHVAPLVLLWVALIGVDRAHADGAHLVTASSLRHRGDP